MQALCHNVDSLILENLLPEMLDSNKATSIYRLIDANVWSVNLSCCFYSNL